MEENFDHNLVYPASLGIFMKRLKVFNTAKIKRNLRGLALFNAKVKKKIPKLKS